MKRNGVKKTAKKVWTLMVRKPNGEQIVLPWHMSRIIHQEVERMVEKEGDPCCK